MAEERAQNDPQDELLRRMLEDAQTEYQSDRAEHEPPSMPSTLAAELPIEQPRSARETLIAEIDAAISAQVDEVLRHPCVQKLEKAWRWLRHLAVQIDLKENTQLLFLNCSKNDLASDFEQAAGVTVAGLYRRLCEPPLSPANADPFTLIVADYQFDRRQQDIELLRNCAAAAADAHAPFIANASPRFFDCDRFAGLAAVSNLRRMFEGARYAPWHSFRDSEDARYVGLCIACNGQPTVPPSFTFATMAADTFSRTGGFDAFDEVAVESSGPDPKLTERQMRDLSSGGLTTFRFAPEGTLSLFSTNSALRPRSFADTPEGRVAERNHRAAAELPNVLEISRVAHYIEALGRELGVRQGGEALEAALQGWLDEHVPMARVHLISKDYIRYELELRGGDTGAEYSLWVAGRLGTQG